MLFVALLIAAKLAVLGVHLATGSSGESVVVVILVALIGSGGLGYWLDRRGNAASRLAQDAVNATEVFQASLSEERKRRDQLERDLTQARADLEAARATVTVNAKRIAELEAQVSDLEAEVRRVTAEQRLKALRGQAHDAP